VQAQEPGERDGRSGDEHRARLGTGSGALDHGAPRLQDAQRLADRGARDAEVGGQLALGRQAVADVQASRREVGLDAVEDLLPGPAAR